MRGSHILSHVVNFAMRVKRVREASMTEASKPTARERILRVLDEAGEEGVSVGELLRATGTRSGELQKRLAALRAEDAITENVEERHYSMTARVIRRKPSK